MDDGAEFSFVKRKDIYVRKCYEDLAKLVRECEKSKVLLIGTPGIGKTAFADYFMWCLAKDGISFVCEGRGESASKHSGGMKTYVPDIKQPGLFSDNMWYIVDGQEPTLNRGIKGHTLLVTSPNRANWYQWSKTGCNILFAPLWSYDEIEKCRELCYPEVQHGLGRRGYVVYGRELYDKWGGVPRYLLSDLTLEAHNLLEGTITSSDPAKLFEFAEKQLEIKEGASMCHRVVHMVANNDYKNFRYEFASAYVRDAVIMKSYESHRDTVFEFIRQLKGVTWGAALYGQVFESLAHYMICRGGTFDIRCLENDNTNVQQLTLSACDTVRFHSWSDVTTYDGNAYYQPVSAQLEGIDSACGNACFQMTVSDSHPVRADGVNEWMKTASAAECRLYFVVPREKFVEFKKQPYHNDKGKVKKAPDGVEQWVMALDVPSSSDVQQTVSRKRELPGQRVSDRLKKTK